MDESSCSGSGVVVQGEEDAGGERNNETDVKREDSLPDGNGCQ